MTPAEVLLKERLDDLRHDDAAGFFPLADHPAPTGTVRTTVDYLLDMAWHALFHSEDEYPDGMAADAHVGAAIDLLTTYRQRLQAWDDLDSDEKMLKLGATKDERGDWTMPEGWKSKATAKREAAESEAA